MAADQRKKRLNAASASLVGCTSRELYRVNRKKLRVQKHDLNMRPNISLEWDNKKKSVVSKREQIGISRRHLNSFLEHGLPCHNILADVFSVPQEIFQLENLSEVLSYEVWENHLSDNERHFLSQFLPNVSEPDTIVRDMLSGDNFHFGNPCVKWGASLCYGELHPDYILHEEQSLKAGKKAYYSDLQKYHLGMIESLQMWKDKWASCKDPEVDIVQNIWSSRWHDKRRVPSLETKFCGNEENLVATPESCSWTNSEMAYSSDNQNLGTALGDSHRRNGFLRKISDNSSGGPKVMVALSKKGEQLHRRNIQHIDGAKYMSYIKVSREQHERVKISMNHASNSIHSRSLNSVLGIDTLNAQPYENFVEEETKKLHQHWLKLATEDIPEGFANWGKRQLQRKELILSLVEEIGHKLECQTTLNEEREGSQNKQMELSDDNEEEITPSVTFEGVENEQPENLLQEQEEDRREANHDMETNTEDDEEGVKSDYAFEPTHDDLKMTGDESIINDQVFIEDDNQEQIASLNDSPRSTMITPPSPVFHFQQKIGSLNSNNPQIDNSLEMESNGDNASARTDEDPSIGDPLTLTSSSDVWPVGDVHGSYYQSSIDVAATNAAGYVPDQFMPDQAVSLLDLETVSRLHDKDVAGKDMLLPRQHTQPSNEMSFFNSYSNYQDRSELLHSLFKSSSNNLSYHNHQQKHPGLVFQPGNENLMVEAGQFPGQFREQVHPTLPLDLRQKKRPSDNLYLHHQNNIHGETMSMYSGGGAGGHFAAIPRQDDLAVNHINEWTAVNNTARLPQVPSQQPPPHLSQNWLFNNNNNSNNIIGGGVDNGTTRDGWLHSLDHNLSMRNSDQTLFSVLSECNELPPRVSYDTMGSVQVGNYTSSSSSSSGFGAGMPAGSSGIGAGILPGSSSNFLQQPSSNYLNGHHEIARMNYNNQGWMGMMPPQQNSGIHDTHLGKSFLRSRNQ